MRSPLRWFYPLLVAGHLHHPVLSIGRLRLFEMDPVGPREPVGRPMENVLAILLRFGRVRPAVAFDQQIAPASGKSFHRYGLGEIVAGRAGREEQDECARLAIDRLLAPEKLPDSRAFIRDDLGCGGAAFGLAGGLPRPLVEPQGSIRVGPIDPAGCAGCDGHQYGRLGEKPHRHLLHSPNGRIPGVFVLPEIAPFALSQSSAGVAQVLTRGDAVPHGLLQLLDLRESSLRGAGPDRLAADSNLEDASRAGHQREFADLRREGREKLLSHPRGAQQPAALRAVLDFDSRSPRHRAPLLYALPEDDHVLPRQHLGYAFEPEALGLDLRTDLLHRHFVL